jgi:DNA-binding beta-propeller fold protein YncE
VTITRGASRRLFRSVLFTDIVGSTELAAQAGDRKWRRIVAAHNAAVRAELKRHGGREVDTAGDGFFAIFENPTDAVRCAAATVAAIHNLGLAIRAGVHTGEVEPSGAKFAGIAVVIGARLMAMAAAREVLVSSTVRDLVAGSGHEFEDRGTHELKGVPGEWHVYGLVMPRFEEGVPLVGVDDDELRAVATRRQRLLLGGLIVAVVLLAASLIGAYLLANRPAPPATGPNSVAVYDTSGPARVRGWTVGNGPSAITIANGVAWIASTDAGTVSRIDMASGAEQRVGQVGTRPSGVAADGSRVWVADRYANRLTVLDARQGNLVEPVELHVSAIASSGDQLWAADDLADQVLRLDPTTNIVVGTVDLQRPAGPMDLAIAAGRVWAAAPRQNALFRIDPTALAADEVTTGLDGVRAVSALGDDLWIAALEADQVARIDAASGRVDVRVDVCDAPVAVAPTATGAWVTCARDRQLWKIDHAGAVTARITLDAVPTDVAADGERAVVTMRAD